MYEEGNRRLSLKWGSLIIKIVMLVVIIFLAGWLFTRITKNNKANNLAANTEYITNIAAMKDAASDYFTESKLPEKVGGTEKLTLAQMLNQKLLIDFTNNGKTCDVNESYIQATKTADGNYALKVSLTCGDKSDFIITSINLKESTNNTANADVIVNDKEESTSQSTTSSSSSSSSSTTSSNKVVATKKPVTTTTTTVTTTVKVNVGCSTCVTPTTTQKTRYYKHVKWSDWVEGCTTDVRAQTKEGTKTSYKFCKYNQKTYYSTGYVTDGTKTNSSYNYELQFIDINPLDVVDSQISIVESSKSYFGANTVDYQAYMDNRGKTLFMTGNTGNNNAAISDAKSFMNSSLKKNNFSFGLSNVYYSADMYRTKVTINYVNKNGITPYYANNLSKNVYFVPLKFDVKYADAKSCQRDFEENSYKYTNHYVSDKYTTTVCMYRLPEYKWSTESSLSGYEYTGEYIDK